ncbi:hypothetical protein [Crenobacter cavernae]|uniref:hypothetical protein n=1 Tax=Crenobacter cavernae TaxID=2290923 RepID=UPI001F0CD7DD|nr:hypothetical protein [Crenobacter cavernae]
MQQFFRVAAHLLAVLQGARRVVGDACQRRRGDEFGQALRLGREHFGEIAGKPADAPRLFSVVRVVLQVMAIFLDGDTAAGRVDHDRLDALFDTWPPRVDVAPHVVKAVFLLVEVIADCAAQANVKHAVVPDVGRDRQGLAAPGVELLQRGDLIHLERSVASANGRGSTLSDASRIKPKVPSEPAISRATS